MDVARGRWSDFPIIAQPAYAAACQIALAEPPGESSVAYTVTNALWRAIMKHGGVPAAAIRGLQVLARTAEADGFEDHEEDSDDEGDAQDSDSEGKQLRAVRTLLYCHKGCPEAVRLCARYELARVTGPCAVLSTCVSGDCHR